jgi:hypothetical protein
MINIKDANGKWVVINENDLPDYKQRLEKAKEEWLNEITKPGRVFMVHNPSNDFSLIQSLRGLIGAYSKLLSESISMFMYYRYVAESGNMRLIDDFINSDLDKLIKKSDELLNKIKSIDGVA